EGQSRGKLTREEIVQKQADIAAEAADVQRVMDKINGITDLAKGRIDAAVKAAQQGSDALERGDSKEAASVAGKTTAMFRELARQVEALAAAETARKVALARDMSEELSQNEQDFAGEIERQQSGKSPGEALDKPDRSKPGSAAKPPKEGDKSKG